MGQVTHQIIAQAIEETDIGLIPNKKNVFTDLNLPVRLFEYLWMGKPVIAPKTRGILDYFDETSLPLFEPGNAASLAHAILELRNNPARQQLMLKRGIDILYQYRWEKQGQTLIQLVKAL